MDSVYLGRVDIAIYLESYIDGTKILILVASTPTPSSSVACKGQQPLYIDYSSLHNRNRENAVNIPFSLQWLKD